MRIVLRPEAQREIAEAQAWYEARAVGLGFAFVRAVDAALGKVSRMPLAYPVVDDAFRHVLLRRFPYSMVYPLGLPNWSWWPASITVAIPRS